MRRGSLRWFLPPFGLLAAGCGAHGQTIAVHAARPRVTGFVVAVGESSFTSHEALFRELEEQARDAGCTRLFAVSYPDGARHPMATAACDDGPSPIAPADKEAP